MTKPWFQTPEVRGEPFEEVGRLDAVETSREVLRRYARVLLPLWAVLFLVDCVQVVIATGLPIAMFETPSSAEAAASFAFLAMMATSALVMVLTFTFAPHVREVMFSGHRATLTDAVRAAPRRIPIVFAVAVVTGLAIGVGLLFCFVPGLIALAFLSRAPWEAACGASFGQSFKRAVAAAKRFDPINASILTVVVWVLIISLLIRIGTFEAASLLDIDPGNLALAISAAAALRVLNLWAWLRFVGVFVTQDAASAGRINETNAASSRLDKFSWLAHVRTNKWFRRIAIVVEMVLLFGLAEAHMDYMVRSAGPAPDFELSALDGDKVPLDKFSGEPAVLYFWAPWCGPCKFQVLALKELQEENPDVQILSIACDYGTEEEVREYAEDNGLAFDVVLGGSIVQAQYGVSAYPTTFVLDGEGEIRFANTGTRSAKDLEAQLNEARDKP